MINHLAFHTMRNLPHCILWGARNEVQVVSRKTNQGCHGAKGALCYDHWAAFRRLDLEASRNWILSNAHARTMGLSSFVSSAWLHISSGVSEPCLWQCGEYNPGFSIWLGAAPVVPTFPSRCCLCQSLWSHHGGAAAPQVTFRIAQLAPSRRGARTL